MWSTAATSTRIAWSRSVRSTCCRTRAASASANGKARGLAGLRLFTGGSTKEFDPSELDDPRSFPAWELCAELGLPMCIQTGPIGLPQVTALAKRFPNVKIILDHLGRPDVPTAAVRQRAEPVRPGAAAENIYMKLTPRIFGDVKKEKASADTFFPRVVDAFGASAWPGARTSRPRPARWRRSWPPRRPAWPA
jgi:predicted TIM-barrel fold metal-dependent hydrolase